MTDTVLERTDVIDITPEVIQDLRGLTCFELKLPNVAVLTTHSISLLRDLPNPQIISLPAVTEFKAEVALELANGFRSQLILPSVTILDRNTLRALSCWKRGWISFPGLKKFPAEAEHVELALHCGNISMVRLFIEYGGMSPNHQFRNRLVPILIAGQHLNAALIRLLIEMGADANAQSHKDGDTILHIACRARSNGLIIYLLDHVDRTLQNLNGRMAVDEYLDNDPIRQRLMPPEPPTSHL